MDLETMEVAMNHSIVDDINLAPNTSTPIASIATTATAINSSNNINNNNSSSTTATTTTTTTTNGKKKRSYDFQNRKIRRRIWQEDEVHKLICVWAARLNDLRQSKKNRHIYEEISEELNRMGLDTIREEVHIKIQNLSQLYRNEKRRIESTGEAPSWQYYHEVDELLGSHADNPMDSSNFDDNNMANSSSIKDEVVSIGDSGSDNDLDESQYASGDNHSSKNGYDHPPKKVKFMQEEPNDFSISRSPAPVAVLPSVQMPYASIPSNKTSVIKASQYNNVSNTIDRKPSQTLNSSMDALLQAIETANSISDANLSPGNVQLEILKEIRKANAMAELERREAKLLHQEMKELEEQRFNLTQMFIERSLALQKQMLDSLRAGGRASKKSDMNGSGSGGSGADSSFKFLPRQTNSRPQFILSKKKK